MEAYSRQLNILLAEPAPSIEGRPRSELKKPISVLLDARKIFDGGIGTYIQNLISGLLHDSRVNLGVVLPADKLSGAHGVLNALKGRAEVFLDPAKPYSVDEYFRLAKRLPQSSYDIYHSPHYTVPFGLKIPVVCTIHDAIHVTHPERAIYPLIAKRIISSSINRADRIITVSKASQSELKKIFPRLKNLDSKLCVVPNALDPYYARVDLDLDAAAEFLANRFHLFGRFVLGVFSNSKTHKGLRDLLTCYSDIKPQFPYKLVLVGAGVEAMVNDEELFERASRCRGIFMLGRVTKEELAHLYCGASALVMASLAEGFCLPVLEAQTFGTPVIARPVEAVKELLTPNDVMCSDFSLESFKKTLLSLPSKPVSGVNEEHLFEHLNPYALEKITERTVEVYDGVLG